MLIDALDLLRKKAAEAERAAIALQMQKAEKLTRELNFSLAVLEELLTDDPISACIGPIRRVAIPDLDDYPEGVSDDDPEVEDPELRKRREEFKDRGFFG